MVEHPLRDGRTFLGILLAPLVGGFLFGAIISCYGLVAFGFTEPNPLAILSYVTAAVVLPFVGLMVMAPVMYLGMALVGVPALLVLHRIGLERWWTYGAFGLLGSGLLRLLLTGKPNFWLWPAGSLILILFWVFARKDR